MALDEDTLRRAQVEVEDQGYSVIQGFLTPDEVLAVKSMLVDEDGARKWAYEGTVKMVSFTNPGDCVLGRIARSKRAHDLTSRILKGPTVLHHTQAVLKEPHSHFSLAFHQDYGYQYHGGVLTPHMCTLLVAIDPCLPTNGGLEVLAGSHLCGRLDHRPKDNTTRQLTVDAERLSAIQSDPRFELHRLSLNPGDGVVFSCVLLHGSGPNESDSTRYALNMAYNRRDNVPVGWEGGKYDVVADDEVIKGGTVFRPEHWGVSPVPLDVHQRLEALHKHKEGEGSLEPEVEFVDPSEEVKGAVEHKCRALKLHWTEESSGGRPRIVVRRRAPVP